MSSVLNEREAARMLGLSVRTLQTWRRVGGGPRYVSLSRRAIRYRIADIEEWMDQRVAQNTTEAEQNRREYTSRESENKNVKHLAQR
ncbi:MAG: helix-turn-helix domain-containing protein [Candidatus Omnitrophica bacterium]|nr:helix-turn-helix domain-containing protein [Candidatus Omnitrophota bacterium]